MRRYVVTFVRHPSSSWIDAESIICEEFSIKSDGSLWLASRDSDGVINREWVIRRDLWITVEGNHT